MNPAQSPTEPINEQLLSRFDAVHQLLLAQNKALAEMRHEVSALRQEVADLKAGRARAKPQALATGPAKPSLSSREMSKMMFVSWASRQPLAFDDETAEARQRRLLPIFESSNNCRVLGVESLR